jgi:protein-tyrosine phosphatase
MAEGLFRRMAEQGGHSWQVRSAGVSAFGGSPISTHSSTILRNKGAKAKGQSDLLTSEKIEWADLILTMTSSHKQLVMRQFPDTVDKVFTLKEYVQDDPRVLSLMAERGELESELQIKQVLSQQISNEDLRRLDKLERQLPDPDIADPFGGSLQDYEACALEIEQALRVLLLKLQKQL